MDREQFNVWIKNHAKRFPAVEKNVLGDVETMDAWYKAMKDVSFERAATVSDMMLKGEVETPHRTEKHIPAIREEISRDLYGDSTTNTGHPEQPKPKRKGGELVYTCKLCLDEGWVTVWHPVAMHAMRSGFFDPKKHIRTCSLFCICEWARRLSEMRSRKLPRVPHYDKTRMVLIERSAGRKEEIENLERFIEDECKPVEWVP